MNKKKKKKGFAVMDSTTRKKIASLGGKTAWLKGTAHRFTSKQAKQAVKARKAGLKWIIKYVCVIRVKKNRGDALNVNIADKKQNKKLKITYLVCNYEAHLQLNKQH